MLLKKCAVCSAYVLSDTHCNAPARAPHPPKFSAEDKYGKYRRMAKMKQETVGV